MAITTYAELKTALANWLKSVPAGTTYVDDIIDMFESEANRTLKSYHRETRKEHAVPAGETHKYVTLPTDWWGARNVRRNCYDAEYVTPEQMAIISPRDWEYDTNGGYFTIENQAVWFYPALQETETIELLYYAAITPLDATNTTNWLLTYYPDIYMYGCMVQAGFLTRDDDLIRRASTMYDRAVTQMMRSDDQDKKYGQGQLQIRAVW